MTFFNCFAFAYSKCSKLCTMAETREGIIAGNRPLTRFWAYHCCVCFSKQKTVQRLISNADLRVVSSTLHLETLHKHLLGVAWWKWKNEINHSPFYNEKSLKIWKPQRKSCKLKFYPQKLGVFSPFSNRLTLAPSYFASLLCPYECLRTVTEKNPTQ